MTKWICDRKECGCAPCRCEIQGSFEPAYCILKDDKTYPKWKLYDTETKYEHIERRTEQKQEGNTLPDWCKVGEWVYDKAINRYSQVAPEDVTDQYTCECISKGEIAPARLRPYNAEELKALVGKVIEGKNKVDCLLVTAYNSGTELYDVASVRTLGEWVTAEELLICGYTLDGHPCGALEHFDPEREEWVE